MHQWGILLGFPLPRRAPLLRLRELHPQELGLEHRVKILQRQSTKTFVMPGLRSTAGALSLPCLKHRLQEVRQPMVGEKMGHRAP